MVRDLGLTRAVVSNIVRVDLEDIARQAPEIAGDREMLARLEAQRVELEARLRE